MSSTLGTVAIGVKAPIVREGDSIVEIVVSSVLGSGISLRDRDIIGVTESLVARAMGLYVTVDDIAKEMRGRFLAASNGRYKSGRVVIDSPIYSRNRFATILHGFARSAEEVVLIMPEEDEVGNVCENHPFTNVSYDKLYDAICKGEGVSSVKIYRSLNAYLSEMPEKTEDERPTVFIYCGLHDYRTIPTTRDFGRDSVQSWLTLADFCSQDPADDFGLLGSNVVGFERLKLFPGCALSHNIVDDIKHEIAERAGVNVECLIYGDGCFHSPYAHGDGKYVRGVSINEFADPVTSPGYTEGLFGKPDELKIKNFVDSQFYGANAYGVEDAVKQAIVARHKEQAPADEEDNTSLGTTPRLIIDQVVSLCDLVTGSGEKGTPIVVIQNYFGNYATEQSVCIDTNPIELNTNMGINS